MSEETGNKNTADGEAKAAGKAAESAPPESAGNGGSVGDLLRKERLTRRITVETIAKDLKLNVGYIKALEASDFASLPPEPYVRVYIKSLTKYLSLDTDGVLRDFDRERGVITDELDKTANKIDISVQKQEKNPAFVVIIALIVILAVFAYVADKKDWLKSDDADHDTPAVVEDTAPADKDSLSLEATDDSTIASLSTPPDAAPEPVKKGPPVRPGTSAP